MTRFTRLVAHSIAFITSMSIFMAQNPSQGEETNSHFTGGRDFAHGFIYQVVTDRFFDGDKSNNDPTISRGMYDAEHKNWHAYWGGDLQGITQKLDYLKALGVTAIWISPAVDNFNVVMKNEKTGQVEAPYHGYHTRDFARIEEHFGDAENSWKPFDDLVAQAHARGIGIVVDFAANHSNPVDGGEYGALFNDGKLVGKFQPDDKKLFHHFGSVTDWNDPFQIQYRQIFDLADLDQCNPEVDKLLKEAALRFQAHGADGFRIDAIKHTTWGWLPSLAAQLEKKRPTVVFGEWFEGDLNGPNFKQSAANVNATGVPILDFPFALSVREVLGRNSKGGFDDFVKLMTQEDTETFKNPGDLFTFIDNHDIPRFQNLNPDPKALHTALALLMTWRGTPCLLYGTEQYLFNGTKGGEDPHDRPMMNSFAEDTPAFKLVRKLSELRSSSDALAYGETQVIEHTPDLFVFARYRGSEKFIVALNRGANSEKITGLKINCESDKYEDILQGAYGGHTLDLAESMSCFLDAHGVAIWKVKPKSSNATSSPAWISKLLPHVVTAGSELFIGGSSFGSKAGTVLLWTADGSTVTCAPERWTDNGVTIKVPKTISTGRATVLVSVADHSSFSGREALVLNTDLIPVTFQIDAADPELDKDKTYFISPKSGELEKWGVMEGERFGPLIADPEGNRFLTLSVPASNRLKFSLAYSKKGSDNFVIGGAREYVVPVDGVGTCALKLKP